MVILREENFTHEIISNGTNSPYPIPLFQINLFNTCVIIKLTRMIMFDANRLSVYLPGSDAMAGERNHHYIR